MRPAVSQVCTLQTPFEQDIADFASAACLEVEIWLGKLEAFLDQHSIDNARAVLARHAIQTPVASYQGGLFDERTESRAASWRHFERRLAICRELPIKTLVVAGDIPPATNLDPRSIVATLQQAADLASARDVRLAFEFQSQAIFANNLETAVHLVSQVGSPHLGICFDVFHYYRGPSKLEDLALLTNENLFHVQLCDLVATPRELAQDSDRILPGDGDFQLAPILDHLRRIDYAGTVSLEIMNPRLWKLAGVQLAEIGITALRKLLGQSGSV
jgi:sugar phosphate isomerase/epimerase